MNAVRPHGRRRRARGRAVGWGAFALAALVAVGCVAPDDGDAERRDRTVHVAVAANFAAVQERLAAEFERMTGADVVASVGSTGQLYAQIRNGAPFDVFLAADTVRPARLVADGLASAASRFTYASGRLTLYSPGDDSGGAPRAGDAGPDAAGGLDVPDPAGGAGDAGAPGGAGHASDPGRGRVPLAAAILARPDARIAIANPETAPYGAAAIQALDRLDVLGRVERRLVRGENVGQAFAFIASGAADLGFVAWSQVVDEPASAYRLVPDTLHPPIRQDAVLLVRAADRTAPRRYLEFLRSDRARRSIEASGYRAEP